jgi:carboxypeptidase T
VDQFAPLSPCVGDSPAHLNARLELTMRLPQTSLALLLAAVVGSVGAATDESLVVIHAQYRDRAQLQTIASQFQHLAVDERTKTITAEASHDDIVALQRAGVSVEIDSASTEQMRTSEAMDVGIDSIPGYSCYRTVEETYATMDLLAAAHPNLARVVDIGPSWLRSRDASAGYRMRVLRLNNVATDVRFPNKANMVVFASLHAREYSPAELTTRFGEWLVNNYGKNAEATWLLDHFRFHLVLQGNPDGRKKAEAGLSWRKNVNNLNGTCSNENAYGTDLNRNFRYRWHTASGGSSSDQCLGNYRGPQPLSEPETASLMRYVAGIPDGNGIYSGGVLPDRRGDVPTSPAAGDYHGMFIDVHSFASMVLWPWSYTDTPPPNAPALRTLGRRLAWFNGYAPHQWHDLYVADGTATDSMYGLLGVPSIHFELAPPFFESCSSFQDSTLPNNLSALRYAARSLYAPYIYPAGPDVTQLAVSPGRLIPGTPVGIGALVDDTRFNQSNGAEAIQRIASAYAYLDGAPWISGSVAAPMVAHDGAFNSSREVVRVALPTTGLAIGRHTVIVRGTDANGSLGTPQGATFTVAGTRSFANGTDVVVPDNSAASSNIAATGIQGTAPASLGVSIDIRHPNIGDLVVDLMGPGGTVYRLHKRTGGTTDNLVANYVVDASSENAVGTWRLRVIDQATGNAGFINQWSLTFSY